jgi:SMI1 / KNR4 family (SUKH-1)
MISTQFQEQLEHLVDLIRRQQFAFDPADEATLACAVQRRVPATLIEFYRFCDGALIGAGDDFMSPDGRRFRLAIPRLAKIQTVQECGYISETAALFTNSGQWWQVLDYGDGNWLALDDTPTGSGQILDVFHETAGELGRQEIVAKSFLDMLALVTESDSIYWLDKHFVGFGYV